MCSFCHSRQVSLLCESKKKVADRISNPTEQRVILKDGRTLGFAEYGDPKGEPVLEFHGCPSCRLEARNYDEAAPDAGLNRMT